MDKMKIKGLKLNTKQKTTQDTNIYTNKQDFEQNIHKINDVTLDRSKIEGNKTKQKIKLVLDDITTKEELGSGVSGKVYKAIHSITQKQFALKIIPYRDDTKLRNFIENEVKALHKFKNDFIIKCYASHFNDKEKSVNILLEFMNQGTLTDIINKATKIPENIIGIMTVQMLNGLNFLHQEKIIHRDIKPSNILINSKGLLKISDFGVSGYLKDSLDNRNTMVGTYMYMAPERIKGENYNCLSDIWSLGMTIIECATGLNPFVYEKRKKEKEYKNEDIHYWILRDILNDQEPPKLSEMEFSDEFCDFVNKCLIKNSNDRLSTKELFNHKFVEMYKDVPLDDLITWLNSLK